ncbi:MAG: ribonuclease T, partial [Shewanella sp.]|nr:ribonuclease T [Shewanella sp.]
VNRWKSLGGWPLLAVGAQDAESSTVE